MKQLYGKKNITLLGDSMKAVYTEQDLREAVVWLKNKLNSKTHWDTYEINLHLNTAFKDLALRATEREEDKIK